MYIVCKILLEKINKYSFQYHKFEGIINLLIHWTGFYNIIGALLSNLFVLFKEIVICEVILKPPQREYLFTMHT